MTIEEAIHILDPATTVEALVEIEYCGGFDGKNASAIAWDEACRIAVAALRTQQEAEKNEPCEFCKEHDNGGWVPGGPHDFRIHDDTLCYYDHVFGWEGCKINYCPMCGRKLFPLKN